MSTYIGIDPGKSGGIAVISPMGVETMKLDTDNVTEADLAHFFSRWRLSPEPSVVCEIVGANRKRSQGERAQGSSSMFTFGQSYGFLRGMLAALEFQRSYRRPQQWQPHFGLTRRKGETDTEKKNRHKAKAQELFPSVKVTLWNCDALLLATYCKQNHTSLF